MGEVESLLSRLVSIDSVNPSLVPGAKGETEIAAFVAGWLRDRGLAVRLQETGLPGRSNVIAVAPGTGGGRSLMLNAHLDTVGVAGMASPFDAAVREERLFGRGSQDTKGALAAFLCAAAEAAPVRHRGDVILTAVVDEEYASVGTEAVARELHADAAIVGEPTGLRVVTEHKGFIWFEVETTGVAAHGSLPAEGVDAIAHMGRVLVALEEEGARLASGPAHPTLGPGSIHASLIDGGQELSSYPARCHLKLERRTIPGEHPQSIEADLGSLLAGMAARDPRFRASLRRTFSRNPMEADRGSAIVRCLSEQVQRVTGRAAVLGGMSGWLDSALLDGAGIPTVVIGPSGAGLHGLQEWVDLDSVRACRDIVRGVIAEFCR